METTHQQEATLSVKDWLITLLIAAIPIVGFIMLFVWGFGDATNTNKANWAKATLLWMAILVAFYSIVMVIFGIGMMSSM